MRRVGAGQAQIDEVIDHIIAGYYEQYGQKAETGAAENIGRFVGAEVTSTVEKMLSIAAAELGRTWGDNIRYGLCLHLKSAIQRVQQGLRIVNPRLGNIRREMPKILEVAQKAIQTAEQDFNIRLPLDEAGFVALFLASEGASIMRHPVVQVIVVAHGKGIATGMAETTNRLLGVNIINGFDMTFDENPSAVYTRIREYLEQRGDVVDVLLLVDMGSLVNYAGDLERELKIRVKCLSLVSTLHVLEAGRKTLLGYSLYDVYEDARRISIRFLDEYHALSKQPVQQLYLLSICTTGEGSAHLLHDYLSEKLDLKGICKIIPLQLADHRALDEKIEHLKDSGRIIGVISAFTTNIPAPHYKISSSMTPQGIARIQRRIDTEAVFIQVEDNLFKTLASLQGSTAIGEIRSMLGRIERALGVELSGEMLVGVFCHIGCMLDRLKHGESVGVFPDKGALLEKYPAETRLIEQECRRLSELYGVQIPQDEVCYILVFFTKESLF
jgi:transcriptional regulatory protein LevR